MRGPSLRAVRTVSLRDARLEDCERVWGWRNDAETRASSFDDRVIPLGEHREWFATTLVQADRRLYIVLADGREAGVVRLDREGAQATVSINIAPEWRRRGVGPDALRRVAQHAFTALGVERLVAHVKAANEASRKAFVRAGFVTLEAGDVLTLVTPPPAAALPAGDQRVEGRRLEALWRGPFGREYTDRNAAKGEKRRRFWENLLTSLEVTRVLEVGCNAGANLRWIRPLVPALYGVDVNEYPLPRLRATVAGVRAAAAIARELPFRDRAFDLVFTMGVLIHHAPDLLPEAMREIVRCSRRYVLCGEYFAESLTEVVYRGQRGALFKQDFGARYQELFPDLRLLRRGRLFEEDGWDDVTFWLFERSKGA